MNPTRIVRSLAFYGAFYGGTVLYLPVAFAAAPFGRRAVRRVVRSWSRHHRRCFQTLLGIRVKVHGQLPTQGALVAMKHESFLEAIELPNLLDHPVIFAKAELLRIPVWGAAARLYGLVPVHRDQGAKALRSMIAAARAKAGEGRTLIIFPEGTRVPHGKLAPLQSGFAALYKLLGLPVVPVAVDSGPLYHCRWKQRGTVTFTVGEPIPPGLPRHEIETRVLRAINAPADA